MHRTTVRASGVRANATIVSHPGTAQAGPTHTYTKFGVMPDAEGADCRLACGRMPEMKVEQPLELKVNPRKWTTKVNIAVVVGVIVVLLVGAGYMIYAAMHQREIQDDLHREVTSPPAP